MTYEGFSLDQQIEITELDNRFDFVVTALPGSAGNLVELTIIGVFSYHGTFTKTVSTEVVEPSRAIITITC